MRRELRDAVRMRCFEDGISVPALLEALLRGFVRKHPAALAMVEQWVRDEGLERRPPSGASLTRREVSDIYAAISRGDGGFDVEED